MTTIDVFDPALCCNSGVCGAEVDQDLVDFSGLVHWATSRGASVERHNLAQQPQDFAGNPVVAELLRTDGAAALPVTLVDGRAAVTGRYPTRQELADWAGLPATTPISLGIVRRRRLRAGLRHLLTDPPSPEKARHHHASARQPTAVPVLHRQGRRRQDLAVLRGGDPARPAGTAGAAGQHRPGVQHRPGLRPAHREHHHPDRRRPRPVRVGDRPAGGGPVLPGPHRRPRPRDPARPTSWPASRNSCPGRAPPRSPRSTSSPRCSPTRRWPGRTTTSSSTPRPPGTPSGCCNCPARGAGSSTPTPKGPPAWGRWPGWRNNASGTPTPSPNCPTRPGPGWCWSPAPTAAPWTRPPAPTTNSPSSDSPGSIWSSTG